jgi:hypothetical protein
MSASAGGGGGRYGGGVQRGWSVGHGAPAARSRARARRRRAGASRPAAGPATQMTPPHQPPGASRSMRPGGHEKDGDTCPAARRPASSSTTSAALMARIRASCLLSSPRRSGARDARPRPAWVAAQGATAGGNWSRGARWRVPERWNARGATIEGVSTARRGPRRRAGRGARPPRLAPRRCAALPRAPRGAGAVALIPPRAVRPTRKEIPPNFPRAARGAAAGPAPGGAAGLGRGSGSGGGDPAAPAPVTPHAGARRAAEAPAAALRPSKPTRDRSRPLPSMSAPYNGAGGPGSR